MKLNNVVRQLIDVLRQRPRRAQTSSKPLPRRDPAETRPPTVIETAHLALWEQDLGQGVLDLARLLPGVVVWPKEDA